MRDAKVALVVVMLLGLWLAPVAAAAEPDEAPTWLAPAQSSSAPEPEAEEEPLTRGILCTPPPTCQNPDVFCICVIRLLPLTCLVFNCNE